MLRLSGMRQPIFRLFMTDAADKYYLGIPRIPQTLLHQKTRKQISCPIIQWTIIYLLLEQQAD